MIVFTSNISLIPYISNRYMIYNLSSYYSGYPSISSLITSIQIFNNTQLPPNEFLYSPQFDMAYYNAIFNNDSLFVDLMKIMINAYNGVDIIVLTAHDDYRDAVTESIIKLIQVRYGYNCWEVEDYDDLELLKESYFTPTGLLTLDQDSARYDMLYASGVVGKINNLDNKE